MLRRNARIAKKEAFERVELTEELENDAKTQTVSKGRGKKTTVVVDVELGSVDKSNEEKTDQHSNLKQEDTEEMSNIISSGSGKSRGRKKTRGYCQEISSEHNILTEKPDQVSDVKQEDSPEGTSQALSNGSGKNRRGRRIAEAQSSSEHKGFAVKTDEVSSAKVEETEEKSEAKIMNTRTTRLRKTAEVSQAESDELTEAAVTQKSGKRKRTVDTSAQKRKKIKEEAKVEEDKSQQEMMIHSSSEYGQQSGSACLKFVGAHTSIAGGLSNAIKETLAMGGRAFGMFLKSQRTWNSKPLEDAAAEIFKTALKESGILPKMVVPHGSYLLNCGSSDDTVWQKSRDALVDELQRCDKLGLPIYNFHPGSSKGEISTEDCIKKISETINYAHSQTSHAITVVENMSGQGNTIGGKFSELRQIIDGVKDKSRIGVCLDTCHAFAAGYNIKSEDGYEQMKKEFVDVIGHNYLKAVHLNDSKGELGCHQDRHENIGKGKLGLATFKRIMNDPFFDNIPMILETPEGDYGKEISKLYGLCD